MIGCRVAMLRSHWSAVPTPLFDNTAAACLLYLPVVEGLIFCISATPHLRTSFPLFHGKGLLRDYTNLRMELFQALIVTQDNIAIQIMWQAIKLIINCCPDKNVT